MYYIYAAKITYFEKPETLSCFHIFNTGVLKILRLGKNIPEEFLRPISAASKPTWTFASGTGSVQTSLASAGIGGESQNKFGAAEIGCKTKQVWLLRSTFVSL